VRYKQKKRKVPASERSLAHLIPVWRRASSSPPPPVYPLLISFLIELFPILENACGCTIGTSLTPTCAEGSLDDLYRITKLDSLNYRLVIIKPSLWASQVAQMVKNLPAIWET